MNKKIYALTAFFCLATLFISCGDDNTTTIDEEWKAMNEQIVNTVRANTAEYKPLASMSGNGSVYWKTYNDFVPKVKSASLKITEDKTPYITDSVVCRYEGWFIKKDGTKYIFDSTETNATPRGFWVNKVIDGWSTILQHMKEGEQIEMCVPYQLAYGTSGYYVGNTQIIPGYTTLWFRMKLIKIIPSNPGEFD